MTDHDIQSIDETHDHLQVLTFVVGTETYGIDILRLQEIRGWSSVTKIPHASTFVLGVMNLRGSVLPVVDLRKRFDVAQVDYCATTVVIVLSVRDGGTSRNVGMVVDAVSDVVEIPTIAITPPPDLGSVEATRHVQGIASIADRLIILLNADRLSGLSGSRDAVGPTSPRPRAAAH